MDVGATVPQTECLSQDGEGMPPHSWSQVDAQKFLVRHGPNYSKNKRKEKSAGGSFYELRAMDWFNNSSHKVDGVAKLAAASGLPEAAFSHPSVPSLLVVNVQLPTEVSERRSSSFIFRVSFVVWYGKHQVQQYIVLVLLCTAVHTQRFILLIMKARSFSGVCIVVNPSSVRTAAATGVSTYIHGCSYFVRSMIWYECSKYRGCSVLLCLLNVTCLPTRLLLLLLSCSLVLLVLTFTSVIQHQ